MLEFADGRVLLVGVRALKGGKLVGHKLQELRAHIPDREVRVAAIYRGGRSVLPEGDTTIEEHDEVFFVAAREDMRIVMQEFTTQEASVRRVVIAGAGNIGFRLAGALEDRLRVKLIERNADSARRAAERLRNTLVLTGNNIASGGTTISAGTLQVGNGGTTGALGAGARGGSSL